MISSTDPSVTWQEERIRSPSATWALLKSRKGGGGGYEWGTSSLDLTYGLVLRGLCIWLFRLQLPARRCKGKG